MTFENSIVWNIEARKEAENDICPQEQETSSGIKFTRHADIEILPAKSERDLMNSLRRKFFVLFDKENIMAKVIKSYPSVHPIYFIKNIRYNADKGRVFSFDVCLPHTFIYYFFEPTVGLGHQYMRKWDIFTEDGKRILLDRTISGSQTP